MNGMKCGLRIIAEALLALRERDPKQLNRTELMSPAAIQAA